mmetsp:Transcript_19078/g.41146  ORF Transcript_19078/g.41146 Transcript_19078/m.41146 type:complete len:212 (-) Transcript_19078:998-1633(-)
MHNTHTQTHITHTHTHTHTHTRTQKHTQTHMRPHVVEAHRTASDGHYSSCVARPSLPCPLIRCTAAPTTQPAQIRPHLLLEKSLYPAACSCHTHQCGAWCMCYTLQQASQSHLHDPTASAPHPAPCASRSAAAPPPAPRMSLMPPPSHSGSGRRGHLPGWRCPSRCRVQPANPGTPQAGTAPQTGGQHAAAGLQGPGSVLRACCSLGPRPV